MQAMFGVKIMPLNPVLEHWFTVFLGILILGSAGEVWTSGLVHVVSDENIRDLHITARNVQSTVAFGS